MCFTITIVLRILTLSGLSVFLVPAHADPTEVLKSLSGTVLVGCSGDWKPAKMRVSIDRVYDDLKAAMGENPRRPDKVALQTARLRYIVLKCAKSVVPGNVQSRVGIETERNKLVNELKELDKAAGQYCLTQDAECALRAAVRNALAEVRIWAMDNRETGNPAAKDLDHGFNVKTALEFQRARQAESVIRETERAFPSRGQPVPPSNLYSEGAAGLRD